jgi:hypothetical protein
MENQQFPSQVKTSSLSPKAKVHSGERFPPPLGNSANHVFGNNVTSGETSPGFTPRLPRHPLDMKAEADIDFIMGENQIIGRLALLRLCLTESQLSRNPAGPSTPPPPSTTQLAPCHA